MRVGEVGLGSELVVVVLTRRDAHDDMDDDCFEIDSGSGEIVHEMNGGYGYGYGQSEIADAMDIQNEMKRKKWNEREKEREKGKGMNDKDKLKASRMDDWVLADTE